MRDQYKEIQQMHKDALILMDDFRTVVTMYSSLRHYDRITQTMYVILFLWKNNW